MPPKVIPPRLHVLIASEAPYAVVLRRWPSKETTTFGWDLTTDTFTYGQWVKARIYPEMCDLSPDGKHLLYFAQTHKGQYVTYFGISIAPYLKAINFYNEAGTYTIGGHWVDTKTFWVEGISSVERECTWLKRVDAPNGRQRSFVFRNQRCGWGHLKEESKDFYYRDFFKEDFGFALLDLLAKVAWNLTGRKKTWIVENQFAKWVGSDWVLIKTVHSDSDAREGKGSYWEDHLLVKRDSQTPILKPDWEWADYDAPRDRILYAEKGKIFAVKLTNDGLGEPTELFDSTQYGRDPVIAPY